MRLRDPRARLREDASHERMHDTWRPDLLQEGLYFADGQIKDEVFEIGSFLQSKMAARGVACSHCHDPHSARLRAQVVGRGRGRGVEPMHNASGPHPDPSHWRVEDARKTLAQLPDFTRQTRLISRR